MATDDPGSDEGIPPSSHVRTKDLLDRVTRTLGGRLPSELVRNYRAIVGPARSDDALVQAALEALQNGARPTALQLAALEQAIRFFRPAIAVKGEAIKLAAEHQAAFPEWPAFLAMVRPHLRAVGRIDRGPKALKTVPDSVGTGFLVSKTLLVTNLHVLEVLSLGAMAFERGMAEVNFVQEQGGVDPEPPALIERLVARHAWLDLALFEIAPPAALRGREPFVVEGGVPDVGKAVVAIGYPFADSERNPLFVNALFDDVFGVKRASPGEVIGIGKDAIHHDCSTLGGNSGSPLLDMATGRVLGVHARGGFAVRNSAVAGSALLELVAQARTAP